MVIKTYGYSKAFPREEIFGITSQMRRAAVSVAANIAEGFVKFSPRDKIRFMNIAQGSLEECKYYILLCRELGYGTDKELVHLAEEVGKLINSYISAIRNHHLKPPPPNS
jgi:four helix bundle protein